MRPPGAQCVRVRSRRCARAPARRTARRSRAAAAAASSDGRTAGRKVRLCVEAEQVFERHDRERRRAARDVGDDCVDRRQRAAHGLIGRRAAGALQRTPQRRAFGRALGFRAGGSRREVGIGRRWIAAGVIGVVAQARRVAFIAIRAIRPMRGRGQPDVVARAVCRPVVPLRVRAAPPFEIDAAPPAGDGRQIVRRRHRDRVAIPVRRRPECAVGVALEPQHAHAGDALRGDPLAKAGRHRAEILADRNRAMPGRLQRDDAQQIVERIARRRAASGRAARSTAAPGRARDRCGCRPHARTPRAAAR
jgi:hypothetical protein